MHRYWVIDLAKLKYITDKVPANNLWLVQLDHVGLNEILDLAKVQKAEIPLENWRWSTRLFTRVQQWNDVVTWVDRIVNHLVD